MKNYLKNELKHIPMMILICIVFYGLKVLADSYALSSTEVSFDNTSTNITATNLQNAINETFLHATDYNEIKTTIGNSTMGTAATTITGAIAEHENDISSLNDQIGNITKRVTITSTNCSTGDHIYSISKTTLGVDDCTQYEWFTHAINWNWESLPLVTSVEKDWVRVREWVVSTALGNATLTLQNGTLPYPFSLVGIKL